LVLLGICAVRSDGTPPVQAAEVRAPASEARFRESPVAHLPPKAVLRELQVSPDNQHLAYALVEGTNTVAYLDGSKLGAYDEVRDMLFSADSRALIYVARRGTNVFLVKDQKEGKAYEDIAKGCLALNADGEHSAYLARQEKKWLAVHDEKEGQPYDTIAKSAIALSPDGLHLAYSAIRKPECYMVVDGKEGPVCDGLGTFTFSLDNRRYGYVVPRETNWMVVIDGKATEYAQVLTNGIIFSPNGQRSLYFARVESARLQAYLDGEAKGEFD